LLDATNFTKIEQEVSLEDYNNTDCPESSNETRTVSYQFDVCSGSQLKNKASLYSAARATGVGIVIMAVLAPLFI
jgi:type 1 fimbria pilin